MVTKHLLVDFGEVISAAQPAVTVKEMADLVCIPVDVFRERYWAFREPYDRGQSAHEYWEKVIGRSVRASELMELRRRDLESWTHLNFATINALRDAHRRGAHLTLLSNAPNDLAREIGQWAVMKQTFSTLLFSAQLRLTKPSEEIFAVALSRAERTPEETLFIDDRQENLRAAQARGIQTHHFTTAEDLLTLLRGIDFLPTSKERRSKLRPLPRLRARL